ncbi:tpr domain containing protein [Stylonychia lemnae]|uniref:Tpr domain containing protein n=1 Tax=Stylonychia lemnae TaxID=5949 RepID=A0A078AIU7_STYLE|nr:tpr domain containing protein [Stylonychia lemnae]|eukprot:CDW80733.1 tpr domain containing protein [Stylonychia lemnae]
MDYLATNNFDQCFKLLKNSEKILINEQHSMTKEKEKPNVALFYLKSSLELEEADPTTEKLNLAGTHLNLCAIYSKLVKHPESIKHAKFAIKILEELIQLRESHKAAAALLLQQQQQQQLTQQQNQTQEEQKRVQFDEQNLNQTNQQKTKEQKEEELKQKQEENNLYLTEAIAYYNLGASYEHILKVEQAVKSYQIAQQIYKIHLGDNHPLSITIEESLRKAQEKKKFSETSHIIRQFMRKEKATTNIFKNSNVAVMFKRIKKQSQMTLFSQENDAQNFQSIDTKAKLFNNKRVNTSQQNRPVKILNRTQANTMNNSLADINSVLNQETIFSDNIDDQLKSNNIMAISSLNNTIQVQSPLQFKLKGPQHHRLRSLDGVQDARHYETNTVNNSVIKKHRNNTSFDYDYNTIGVRVKKPSTANQAIRSRSYKNNNISQNVRTHQRMSSQTGYPYENERSEILQSQNGQRPQLIQPLSMYSNYRQPRLLMDLENFRFNQFSPQRVDGLPEDKSLSRLNKRLKTLEVQVSNQLNQ